MATAHSSDTQTAHGPHPHKQKNKGHNHKGPNKDHPTWPPMAIIWVGVSRMCTATKEQSVQYIGPKPIGQRGIQQIDPILTLHGDRQTEARVTENVFYKQYYNS